MFSFIVSNSGFLIHRLLVSGIILRTVQLLRRYELTRQRWIKNPEFKIMKENIQLTQLDQEISWINPESRIDPGRRVNSENWFNPETRINLDSQINIRFESIFQLNQTSRIHWHDQWKTLHRQHQWKFIIKISKWLDQTKMLVESNSGSQINPGSWINPEGRFNLDSRINLESRINCLIWINSLIRPLAA